MSVYFPEVITAITAIDGYFKRTLLTFRKTKDKLNVVTKIVCSLLVHPSVNVCGFASCIFQTEEKSGLFEQSAGVSIADAHRLKIERHGNPLGLTLETVPEKTGITVKDRCMLLKGKFRNKKKSVYCKLPSPPCSLWDWVEMRKGQIVKQDIRLLTHLQQQSESENIITLLAYSADVNFQPPYYLFSCNELDMSLSEYLVRCVRHEIEVPLRERIIMAIGVLNAVKYCNHYNVLIRHICAHAFLLTRTGGHVVAKLANFSRACILNADDNRTATYYGR